MATLDRTRVLVLAGVVAAALAALAALAGGSAQAAPQAYAPNPNAAFTTVCAFSHRNTDDLVRFPGRPGLSHNHTYVANRSTNAMSTLASLRAGGTTCDRQTDTAAYWMPTLYANDLPVVPDRGTAYYTRATVRKVVAYPAGFRVIAGNMMAAKAQSLGVVAWNCRGGSVGATALATTAPNCPTDARLALQVSFPSCWDGHSLDSVSHASHVAYPTAGRCPAKHPVALPALTLVYQYPPIAAGSVISLASGSQYTAHADFVNSWNQAALKQLVTLCLNEARGCRQLPPREE